jgi:N-terminal domain of galactosyltransferase
MGVSIVVPFRPDGAERERNWKWLRARYERLYPDWEIVEGTCEGQWSKGEAVNPAVARSSGDVLVIADADVMVGEQALPAAVRELEGAPWVIPHGLVYRLTEKATRAVISGELRAGPTRLPRARLARRPLKGPSGGGMTVARREDFEAVGGIDERFTDWGGEDISFARALDTLIGPHLRLDEVMWHLYHQPMRRRPPNRASGANEALAAHYLDAAGDPVAMAALCVERPYKGLMGGGIVVAGREVVEQVPFDPRFTGWGHEDTAWAIAVSCLAGPPKRSQAPLVHLHHPPPERMTRGRGSPANVRLRRRYGVAGSNPERMKELISECR